MISAAAAGLRAQPADSAPTLGITAKILSTNVPNNFVVGAGVTFSPCAEDDNLGLDLNVGYLMPNFVLLGDYDLLRQQLQVSGGWVPAKDEEQCDRSPKLAYTVTIFGCA